MKCIFSFIAFDVDLYFKSMFNLKAYTVGDISFGTLGIFHTKLSFLGGFYRQKHCLILLRVKQHIQGEHKLKFLLKIFTNFKIEQVIKRNDLFSLLC